MHKKSDLQHLIDWLKTAHWITVSLYIIGFSAFFLTLIRSNDFIYRPIGLFYQYTIYLIPPIILFIIIFLQIKPYHNYNDNGDKTWLYKQPLKIRKCIRLITNLVQVSLITILVYYSIGILASYFPQHYRYYAYSTKISWKDTYYSRKRNTHYQIGTEMTDNLMPNNHKVVYKIVSGLNRNYFFTKARTYKDMFIGKKINILSKTSLLWGEYLYDIDYDISTIHYTNSTNKSIDTCKKDTNITNNSHTYQNNFQTKVHKKILPKVSTEIVNKPIYPKSFIKYEE